MSNLREAAQQEPVLYVHPSTYAMESANQIGVWRPGCQLDDYLPLYFAPQPKAEPWTQRELELIDGMIEVQLHHADQCDRIANRPMAEKQKGWDMERVALLRKIRDTAPQPRKRLSDREIADLWSWSMTAEAERTANTQQHAFARAIEAAVWGEKT